MARIFNRIGLIGRQRKEGISDSLITLQNILQERQLAVFIETETATHLNNNQLPTYPRTELAAHCDLLIVVGGDGSLLNAARGAIDSLTPVLGINRGHLGFLTDINPNELYSKISDVLDGNYIEEQRFLLSAQIWQEDKIINEDIALNDIVLMPGESPLMIEFSIIIDEQFVCSQRADGLITATPTGSTAYALSGGGPILHPSLNAVVLVPMFPHTLSARPIVISGDSSIRLNLAPTNQATARLSCDGQTPLTVPPGASIRIGKKSKQLRLIHPLDYNYFQTLRTKLHWNTKL